MTLFTPIPASAPKCELCDGGVMRRSTREVAFTWGEGADRVKLVAHVPVSSCEACGISYEDEGAEEIRHDAVCAHLGRLTPSEIQAFRRGQGLTQQQFAAMTGLGIASVKRWEAGNQIQSFFADRMLRVLRDGGVFDVLRSIAEPRAPQPAPAASRFRTTISAQSRRDAGFFTLRPDRTVLEQRVA